MRCAGADATQTPAPQAMAMQSIRQAAAASIGVRSQAGKDPVGLITVNLRHEGNDVSVEFSDDGAGLDLQRIREKAISLGLLSAGQALSDQEAVNLIFMTGFSTASQVTELSGRGIDMDVVRAEVKEVVRNIAVLRPLLEFINRLKYPKNGPDKLLKK